HSEDVWVWGGSRNDDFSLKFAYSLVDDRNTWKVVWNWKEPSRVKLFLWLTRHGCLLTNAERFRRHMTTHEGCIRCNHDSETTFHILDGTEARGLTRKVLAWTDVVDSALSIDSRILDHQARREWDNIAWDPGPSDRVTINTDGSVDP
ncbi:Putative ribonuclease H protein At1g65750, partial [Linum perenne]